ncbi:alpha/beta hydrolase [Tsukamurella sp. 8F]|uniref:alpha/beta hydrolase n=1 Tax=unclassified Tsukamurella TaxID=2633480 RepID=UPI0023B9BD19|nr:MULTISPECIES: alpha/beta hydrolase [unclassified Tsukamurella]MDF0529552.1 alpha/beta hydrolase [Tsukamurella sp. 8J]MDF0585760.1 alpha/beta hydrolase [Tsukamurella sp. 8F]
MPVIAHRGRSVRAFVLFWFVRIVMKTVMRFFPMRRLDLLRTVEPWLAKVPQSVRGATIEQTTIAGVPAEKIVPIGVDMRPDTALAYYHGGAFIAGNLDSHRRIAVMLARGLRVPVYNVEYRQYPDGGVGTSAHDGYQAYRELLDDGFDRVVVAGDSAGGYVSAKVIEYAARDGAPRPAAFIGFSPFLNIAADPRRSGRYDAMLPIRRIAHLQAIFAQGPEALDGPEDMTTDETAADFPPTVVTCANREALELDARNLAESLDRAGVENELHVYDGQVHAFPVAIGATRESLDAYRTVVEFVGERLDDLEAAHAEQPAGTGAA